MLSISNLSKSYGTTEVLNIESLDVSKGTIFGLVGNNGAGKTTLFSLALDLVKASSGSVHINGIDVSKSEEWKNIIGAYISEGFLIDFLSPEEYFQFIAELHNWNASDLSNFLIQFEDFFNDEILSKNKYIRDLSKGNQKKVGIVGALIGDPELIILDEPFANLDPSSQSKLKKIISSLDRANKTILISSHDLNHIAEICTRIVVLNQGVIVKDILHSESALEDLRLHFEGN